jgi:hypothetical protein
MADGISFKAIPVERIANEMNLFLLMFSLVLALDSALFLVSDKSILNLDWIFVQGVNIGYVLLFFTVFSFVMTVAAPFVFIVLRTFLVVVMKPLPTRLTDWYFKHEDGVPSGCVRTSQLRDFALSNKENFFLLDLVEKQEQCAASEEFQNYKRAVVALSVALFWLGNAVVGASTHRTILWKMFTTTSNVLSSLLAVVWLLLFILLVILLWPALRHNVITYRNRRWVCYPPLANEEMKRGYRVTPPSRFQKG